MEWRDPPSFFVFTISTLSGVGEAMADPEGQTLG